VYYEGLQDKLAQIRDARGALSALREEHREKLRRAAEEAERQRQIQLAQKLEIMRQKKQVQPPNPACGLGRPRLAQAGLTTTLSPVIGVPGGSEATGHPTPAGAGEGTADASGATETDRPDARSDACLPPALCPGNCYPTLPTSCRPGTSVTAIFFVSSSRPCPRLGVCSTSPQAQPAFLAPSAQQAQWRAPPCMVST
jgi:hypothetical protein